MFLDQFKLAAKRFRDEEEGVALVEFAIFLPLFVLSFFVIVEFARIFFSYQGAVVGVRDATRYLARTTDAGVCINQSDGTATIVATSLTDGHDAYRIIRRNMNNESDVLPNNVAITAVSSSYRCVRQAAGNFRQLEIPIARVVATITIDLPLVGIMELNGLTILDPITTTVADESRVFGV